MPSSWKLEPGHKYGECVGGRPAHSSNSTMATSLRVTDVITKSDLRYLDFGPRSQRLFVSTPHSKYGSKDLNVTQRKYQNGICHILPLQEFSLVVDSISCTCETRPTASSWCQRTGDGSRIWLDMPWIHRPGHIQSGPRRWTRCHECKYSS